MKNIISIIFSVKTISVILSLLWLYCLVMLLISKTYIDIFKYIIAMLMIMLELNYDSKKGVVN